jgi:hypothetical protein
MLTEQPVLLQENSNDKDHKRCVGGKRRKTAATMNFFLSHAKNLKKERERFFKNIYN